MQGEGLFCAGGLRSALAAKTLKDMGFKNVAHVNGGFDALKKGGLKVIEKEKPDIVILTASNSIVSSSEKNPDITLKTNVFSQVHIFDVIKSLNKN